MSKAIQLIAIFFITLGCIFAIANIAAAIALGIAGIIALISSRVFSFGSYHPSQAAAYLAISTNPNKDCAGALPKD
jgi:membrane-bound ClpP family serine protease